MRTRLIIMMFTCRSEPSFIFPNMNLLMSHIIVKLWSYDLFHDKNVDRQILKLSNVNAFSQRYPNDRETVM